MRKSVKGFQNIGLSLIAVILLMAIIGLIYTPYDPLDINLEQGLQSPSLQHLMGTDQFGRDVLSRILSATVVSVMISFFTTLFALVSGALLGATIGYLGGWVDKVAMVILDAFMALPAILLAMGIMVVLGPSQIGMILALGIAFTPNVARVVRGTVFSIKQREYIEASRVLGNAEWFTVLRHVLPNCATPLLVMATTLFAFSLLAESALSFLGLGAPPPNPTWGGMLSDARQYVSIAPWLCLFPGMIISIALLGINMFGDALRDRFDPRMK